MYPKSSESKTSKLLSSANRPHPSNLWEGLFKSSSLVTFQILFAKFLQIFNFFVDSVLYFLSFWEQPKHNKSSNSGKILKQSSGIKLSIYSLIFPSFIILQHAASLCL